MDETDDWAAFYEGKDWLVFYAGKWDEAPDLWEHQGEELTVGKLRLVLKGLPDDLPLTLAMYTGDGGTATAVSPVEIGFTGKGDRPDALVVTGALT
jgi:hypothetical protein